MLIKKSLQLFFIIVLIQIAVTFAYSLSLPSVKYSFVGDEYGTYSYAQAILHKKVTPNIFTLNGANRENPALGSYYQTVWMRLLGESIYSWKFSSIFIIFPLGLLFFYLVKKCSDTKIAFLGLFMLDSSYCLYNFFQIGYLDNQSLLCLVAILYLITFLESDKKAVLYFFLLGILTGLSWYMYIGKLFIFVVTFFLIFIKTRYKHFFKLFLYYFIPAFLLILVSFLFTDKNVLLFRRTTLYPEFNNYFYIIINILRPWYIYLHTTIQTHYLSSDAYVDKITAFLALTGICSIILSPHNKKIIISKYYKDVFLLFILLSIAVGITLPYTFPYLPRYMHFIPFYILFACCGYYVLQHLIKSKTMRNVLFIVVCFSTTLLNIYFILRPLPLNTTQELFGYIKKSDAKNIVLINNCNVNFYNQQTLVEGYLLKKTVTVADTLDKQYCSKYDLIFSCSPISCSSIKERNFDNKIGVFRTLKTN